VLEPTGPAEPAVLVLIGGCGRTRQAATVWTFDPSGRLARGAGQRPDPGARMAPRSAAGFL